MSDTVHVCNNCGARPTKIISFINNETFNFCNLSCKNAFFAKKYLEIVRKINENKGVLPQVRTFIARKTKGGFTVVRRNSGMDSGAAAGENKRKGSSSS